MAPSLLALRRTRRTTKPPQLVMLTRLSSTFSLCGPPTVIVCFFWNACRNPKCVIASAGMQADMEALHKKLHTQHVMYQFNHRKPMACPAMAQLLSNTLYQKRFFPFYTFNLCAGLDDEGELQPCSSTLWQAVVQNDYGRTMRQIAADGPP